MSKKHIVLLTDKQINLLLSCILTEYEATLDDSGSYGYKGRMHPDDVRNGRMVDNIKKALVNSMEV